MSEKYAVADDAGTVIRCKCITGIRKIEYKTKWVNENRTVNLYMFAVYNDETLIDLEYNNRPDAEVVYNFLKKGLIEGTL